MDHKSIVLDETIPAGKPWGHIIEKGQILKIIDIKGHQGVDFLCYNADKPEERYNAPNTLKAAQTIKLTKGHVLYSDEARPMFTIIEDTYGQHDTISGCCSAHSNAMLYNTMGCPGCRENFIEALGCFNLGRRDIVPNINFFCNVPVSTDGTFNNTIFVKGNYIPGAFIELQAKMRAIAIISNCPQINNPCNDGEPKPISVSIRSLN